MGDLGQLCLHVSNVRALEVLRAASTDTDEASSSWIGDWWGGWGFACSPLCLTSDPNRLTQSHSDPHPRDRLTQTCSDPPSTTQVYPISFNLTQIRSVSFRSTQPQTQDSLRSAWSLSESFRFMQPRTDLIRLMKFRSGSHSDSLRFTQPASISSRSTQIRSDLLRLDS